MIPKASVLLSLTLYVRMMNSRSNLNNYTFSCSMRRIV